jgi:hypothetical protein
MKKYLSLVMLASMMQMAQGAADETTNSDERIYVRPRAVRFMKKKTVVFTKDGAFVTPTVSRDEKGLFVQAKDLEKVPEQLSQKIAKRYKANKKFGNRGFASKRAIHKGACNKRAGNKRTGDQGRGCGKHAMRPQHNKKAENGWRNKRRANRSDVAVQAPEQNL